MILCGPTPLLLFAHRTATISIASHRNLAQEDLQPYKLHKGLGAWGPFQHSGDSVLHIMHKWSFFMSLLAFIF